jgi:hypothetical protein
LATYDNNGGGIANNAFNNDNNLICNQSVANGNISYDYGETNYKTINFIGIKSGDTRTYSLIIEVSDYPTIVGQSTSWVELANIEPQIFNKDQTIWIDVTLPKKARAIRIREINGATLVIKEIYFANNTADLLLASISRDSYMSFSQKNAQGRPSCYYFDKQITPILNIWQTSSEDYKVLQYSYVNIMQDAGGFYNITDIPSRMLPALTWGLSWMLSIKYNPAVAVDMKNEYEQAFNMATANDSENANLTLNYDVSKYNEN